MQRDLQFYGPGQIQSTGKIYRAQSVVYRIYKIRQDFHVNPEKSCKSCLTVISLELPAQRGAHAEVVLVGSYRWLAVEVFVHVKTPPKILHDFDPQI